jgi:rare lipoprotein A
MRTKLFLSWAAVRWLVLMFLVTPALDSPAYERPEPKPLRTWEGLSSWYGPRFHGRKTANGEIYDMYGPTAAHPTLPLGSVVRVTDKKTGLSRVARINDRGPFIEGREIDLSYEVARSIGLEHRGIGAVRIELLYLPQRRAKPQPQPQPQQPPDSRSGL